MIRLSWGLVAVAVAASSVAAAGGAWTARGWKADAALNKLASDHAQAIAAAERQARADSAASAATADRLAQLAQEATDALASAQARLDRAAVALDGTRGRVFDAWTDNAAASRCPDPNNPAAVAAAAEADVVRADVFRSATARAVELAGAVDQLDAYAHSCAARFRQVREQLDLLRERLAQ